VNWDAWQKLPVLTRDDIRAHGNALRPTALPEPHTKTFQLTTSGSSGSPVTIHKSAISDIYWKALSTRDHLWHKRDLRLRHATLRHMDGNKAAPPNGAVFPRWGPSWVQQDERGEHHILTIDADLRDQVRWLTKVDPHYLLIYPTLLRELCQHAEETGWKMPSLRHVRTLSETVTPELRERTMAAFGVRIADMYSCKEVGYLALQAPDSDAYLIQSEGALVEILRDDGTPAEIGEIGRVVATNLHNMAMPLLRYDVGDYAERGEPLPGYGLPVLRRVHGRNRDMLRYPDGRRRWPTYMLPMGKELGPIRHYQVVQDDLNHLTVRLVIEPGGALDESRLRSGIVERLGHPFELDIEIVKKIPRVSGKYFDFLSELKSP